ncbi:MAG: hypothetical protein AAF380_02330, partial [Bacteroidota bacterium]
YDYGTYRPDYQNRFVNHNVCLNCYLFHILALAKEWYKHEDQIITYLDHYLLENEPGELKLLKMIFEWAAPISLPANDFSSVDIPCQANSIFSVQWDGKAEDSPASNSSKVQQALCQQINKKIKQVNESHPQLNQSQSPLLTSHPQGQECLVPVVRLEYINAINYKVFVMHRGKKNEMTCLKLEEVSDKYVGRHIICDNCNHEISDPGTCCFSYDYATGAYFETYNICPSCVDQLLAKQWDKHKDKLVSHLINILAKDNQLQPEDLSKLISDKLASISFAENDSPSASTPCQDNPIFSVQWFHLSPNHTPEELLASESNAQKILSQHLRELQAQTPQPQNQPSAPNQPTQQVHQKAPQAPQTQSQPSAPHTHTQPTQKVQESKPQTPQTQSQFATPKKQSYTLEATLALSIILSTSAIIIIHHLKKQPHQPNPTKKPKKRSYPSKNYPIKQKAH